MLTKDSLEVLALTISNGDTIYVSTYLDVVLFKWAPVTNVVICDTDGI